MSHFQGVEKAKKKYYSLYVKKEPEAQRVYNLSKVTEIVINRVRIGQPSEKPAKNLLPCCTDGTQVVK